MDQKKHFLIDTLFKLLKIKEEAEFSCANMFVTMSIMYPKIHASFFNELRDKYGSVFFLEKLKEIYHSVFSEQELSELIKFYSSPIGSKIVSDKIISSQKKLGKDWGNVLNQACLEFLETNN